MATRSMIGILRQDGIVTGIYCHNDGYVDGGVGQMLVEHWDTQDKVEELMKLGQISVLGKTIGTKVDFDTFRGREQCLAYHRDRGECLRSSKRFTDRDEYIKMSDFCDYFYLFDGAEWHYSTNDGWWNKVQDYVKESPEISAG